MEGEEEGRGGGREGGPEGARRPKRRTGGERSRANGPAPARGRSDEPARAGEGGGGGGGGGGDEAHRAHGAAPAEVFAVPGADVVVELGPLRGVVVVAHPPAPPRPDVRATRPGRGARVRVRRGRALRAVLGEHEGAARGRRAARGGRRLAAARARRGGHRARVGGVCATARGGGRPSVIRLFVWRTLITRARNPRPEGHVEGCVKHRTVSARFVGSRFEWAGSLEKVN